MLSEAELEDIRRGLREGLRGPVLVKWLEQLLEDRVELTVRLRACDTHGTVTGQPARRTDRR